jgi:hypothetical protein
VTDAMLAAVAVAGSRGYPEDPALRASRRARHAAAASLRSRSNVSFRPRSASGSSSKCVNPRLAAGRQTAHWKVPSRQTP